MILFLNKIDLFEDHLKLFPIKSIPPFNDYEGKENDVSDGVNYFKKKFLEKNRSRDPKFVYIHVTCATDTKSVHVVFEACRNTILFTNLEDTSWINEYK